MLSNLIIEIVSVLLSYKIAGTEHMFSGIIFMIMMGIGIPSLDAMVEAGAPDAVKEENLSGGYVVVQSMSSRFYCAAVTMMVKASTKLLKPKIIAFFDVEKIKFKGPSYRSVDYKASREAFKKEVWVLYEELSHTLLDDIKEVAMRDAVTAGAKVELEQWLDRMLIKYHMKLCLEYLRDEMIACNEMLAGMRVRDGA